MITITKKNISFFLIYSLPIIFLIIFIAIFGVNFPFMDEWALVDIVEKTTSNTITFQDFFAQHNEHRIFFPRLIFIVFLLIFGWNTKYMMYFSVFLAILSFFYLYKIATYKHKIKSPVGLNHLPNILMCFLLFSLIQQENWLWGFQIAWFLVNLCLIIAVFCLVNINGENLNKKISFSALFCFIASFSAAHGLLTWIALIPSILGVQVQKKKKVQIIFIWMFLFFLCSFIYLMGYQKPSHHPDILFSVDEIIIRVKYFLVLIGRLGSSINFEFILGAYILILFIGFNIDFYLNHSIKLKNNFIPWLSIGWYSILFALLTTLGRGGFGIDQAQAGRYATPMILLYISILQLSYLYWYRNKSQKLKYKVIFKSVNLSFCLFVLFGLVTTSIDSVKLHTHDIVGNRTQGKTCLEKIDIERSLTETQRKCLQILYPDPDELIKRYNRLKKTGYYLF